MTFESELKEYAKSIPNKLEHIDGEETTKIALITPFLRLLGYDTTDPSIVKAEYTADVGTKQGEKVDFAILDNGKPVIFIECKSAQNKLSEANVSQLYRYFSITDVQIGILTNGIEYMFYTTGNDNRMDEKPFLEINLLNITNKDIKELEKFIEGNFNLEEIVDRADNLKYRNLIKKVMLNELENPSDEFIKTIGKQVYDGKLTPNVKERFGKIIVAVNNEIINDKVQKRLSDAVQSNEDATAEDEAIEEEQISPNVVITTDLEKEGYYIIRSIASEHDFENHVNIRNQKQYCNILFENNRNYPICRFYFNNEKRLKIELFDKVRKNSKGTKIGDKQDIEKVSDIYNYKDRILAIIDKYSEEKSK